LRGGEVAMGAGGGGLRRVAECPAAHPRTWNSRAMLQRGPHGSFPDPEGGGGTSAGPWKEYGQWTVGRPPGTEGGREGRSSSPLVGCAIGRKSAKAAGDGGRILRAW
jgi:hypothetical protein